MTIQWVQGQTSPVHLSFGIDLTGYTVVMHVHPQWYPGEAPLQVVPVSITNAETGACDVVPPETVAPGTYTVDFDLTSSDGSLSPGEARTTATVLEHSNEEPNITILDGGSA